MYYSICGNSASNTNDYTYTYDAVGNVQVVYRASGTVGQEAYFFAQDAFGNELSGDTTTPASNRTNLLGGASWTTARTAGITEHQTGKIQSSFTGLVYFGARWYDPVVGRWVSRSTLPTFIEQQYEYNNSNPVYFVDTNGVYGWYPYPGHTEPPKIPDFLKPPYHLIPDWMLPIVPTGNLPGHKFLECFSSCIEENDPVVLIGQFGIELLGQLIPKRWVANIAGYYGDSKWKEELLKQCKNPEMAKVTTPESILQHYFSDLNIRPLGDRVSFLWILYAGYLGVIEPACAIQCYRGEYCGKDGSCYQ